MDINVNQLILHILDTNINEAVLSDSVLTPDAAVNVFLSEHISNACQSDSVKQCSLVEGSAFYGLIEASGGDFVIFSKLVATRFFETMQKNVSIPSGDLVVADLNIDGTPYAGVFKLNYKTAFIHHHSGNDGAKANSIILQRTVLPSSSGKPDEFFPFEYGQYEP